MFVLTEYCEILNLAQCIKRKKEEYNMQENKYEYLKLISKAPFNMIAVAGSTVEIPPELLTLFYELREIEYNHELLKKLDELLKGPTQEILSDIEIKVAMKSCTHAVVLGINRLLEEPIKRNRKKTSCIYTVIWHCVKDENLKHRCYARRKFIIDQSGYKSLKRIKDKIISHREDGILDELTSTIIGSFLSQTDVTQSLIEAIAGLLELISTSGGGVKVTYDPEPCFSQNRG